MNIFQTYTDLIVKLIKKNQVKLEITVTNNFKGVTVECPPPEFGVFSIAWKLSSSS